MAKITEAVTLGIGVQSDQATVNSAVRDAVALGTAAASGTTATGILLRNPEDLSMAFERVESDGGVVPGSLSRLSGVEQKIDGTVSFTIDAMGNRVATGTPDAGDYTFAEYMERILAGARLERGVEDAAFTPYEFAAVQEYQTLKIWRGTTESWTLVGCTFQLTWNFTAGEKATIDVEVIFVSVIHVNNDTFPPEDLATAFGNQRLAAPILELAGASVDSIVRGFISGTLAVTHEELDFQDSNVTTGTGKEQGTRSVDASFDFYADTLETAGDFTKLQDDLDSGTSPILPLTFVLGIPAPGAGDIPNAQDFDIPNLRMLENTKVDAANRVVRTLAGYAAIAGSSGPGFAAGEEFVLKAV